MLKRYEQFMTAVNAAAISKQAPIYVLLMAVASRSASLAIKMSVMVQYTCPCAVSAVREVMLLKC